MAKRYGRYRHNKKRSYRRDRRYRKQSSTKVFLVLVCIIVLWAIVSDAVWALILGMIVGLVPVVIKYIQYKKSAYYQITKTMYLTLLFDKGKHGEYLTYKAIKHLEQSGARFLFNTYIPKGNGETTEIDVLMVCSKGVFVFESKNYSGWIFGDEHQLYWYQTLPSGRKSHKEQFYNPIMQNDTHIRWLRKLLGEQIPMYSIIVFSERCTLKSIQVQSEHIRVINRQDLKTTVSDIYTQNQGDYLDESYVSSIFETLYPFTQVDKNTKEKHVENIRSSYQHNVVTNEEMIDAFPVLDVNMDQVPLAETDMNVTNSVEIIECDEVLKSPNSWDVENQDQGATANGQVSMRCPWCNGELVLRTAKKGNNAGRQFYGCSNYPRCKYVNNLTDTIIQ